jgi:hypothetical protein
MCSPRLRAARNEAKCTEAEMAGLDVGEGR